MKVIRKDARAYPRTDLERPIEMEGTLEGRAIYTGVLNYSFEGVRIYLPHNIEKELGDREIDISLNWKGAKLPGVVRHVHGAHMLITAGVQLGQNDALENLARGNSGWDWLHDKEDIRNLCSDMAFKGPECLTHISQISCRGKLIPHKLLNDKVMVFEVYALDRGHLEEGRAQFYFEIFQTAHRFDAKILKISGNFLDVAIPETIGRLLRRETTRMQVQDLGKSLTIDFRCDAIGVSQKAVPAIDFNEHGLSMIAQGAMLCAPAHLNLEELTINVGPDESISGRGVIRTLRWSPLTKGYVVGLRFEASDPKEENKWHNLVLSSRYPTLNFNYQPEDHEKIWKLFERSGYVGHLTEAVSKDVVLKYEVTKNIWMCLQTAGSRNSRRLLYGKTEESVSGHLQMDRYYSRTWCVHHLAIDPTISKLAGKDLYSSVTDVLSAENAKYLITFHRPDLSWNKKNYYDFIDRYPQKNHNSLERFSLYDFGPSGDVPVSERTLVCVIDSPKAFPKYFEQVKSHLIEKLPPLVFEALDLAGSDPFLIGLNDEMSRYALRRKRLFIVAVRNESVVAFTQIELGSTAVNIFNLFDTVYYECVARDVTEMEIRDLWSMTECALLKCGKSRVLLLLREGQVEQLEALGVHQNRTYLVDEYRWLAHCDAFRSYHAYSQALFGKLILRRLAIRGPHGRSGRKGT